ncbi:hypothetical protein [Streptomyces sp. NPDC013171]|uniref:hypothetical protein n=1 Tax=Streptomyces sp. NPDC013171 TaxID=3364863 RepID=UPI00367758B2
MSATDGRRHPHEHVEDDELRPALDAVGQLALELDEFTWDPDAEPYEDDEALIELGVAFYDDAPAAPPRYADSIRPATRPAEVADKYSSLRRLRPITDLPPLDDYQPPTAA